MLPDQYSADKKSIGELLNAASSDVAVPDWQRNYSWDAAEVSEFWKDLVDFQDLYPGDHNIADQEYFLGSIVLVTGEGPHTLLDGQQRLATATILLSVVRDYVRRYRADAATRTQETYIAHYDDASDRTSYKLTLNRFDREFFRREVQTIRNDDYEAPSADLASHKLIRRARRYFEQKFEDVYGEQEPEGAFRWALWIRKVVTEHMSVVAISSRDEDNAASVFETLNDRGIGLSTPDLLRNLLLRRAPEEDRDAILDAWGTVLDLSEYGGARVEEFLRHYWISHRGDVKTRSLYREIRRTIEDENRSSIEVSRDLESSAEIYSDLITARADDGELATDLAAIQALGARALLPAAMSGFAVTDDVSLRKKLARALVVLYVRYAVIGKLEGTLLEARVYEVARRLREDQDIDAAVGPLKEIAPNDEEFEKAFGSATVTKSKPAGYLLRELEEARRGEGEVKTPSVVHVEHIYPRTPANGRFDNHDDVVNLIGNLTLLAHRPNKAIRNGAFDMKKEKAYAESQIEITKELVDYADWNEENIAARQKHLAQEAVSVWRFDS
ncbi:MAG: DUF262 domain-containing protein [Gaiellaceae bacterium]